MNWIDSVLGTIFYSVVVFMAGAMIGPHFWCWVKRKCPFFSCNKDCKVGE